MSEKKKTLKRVCFSSTKMNFKVFLSVNELHKASAKSLEGPAVTQKLKWSRGESYRELTAMEAELQKTGTQTDVQLKSCKKPFFFHLLEQITNPKFPSGQFRIFLTFIRAELYR